MARFVFTGSYPSPITLEADEGEELTPEQVAAAAAIMSANTLGAIQDQLSEIAEALHTANG